MFGNDDQPGAIDDSRELAQLAEALGDPEKRDLLEQGHSLQEVMIRSQPADAQFRTGINQINRTVERLQLAASGAELDRDLRERLLQMLDRIIRRLNDIKRLLGE